MFILRNYRILTGGSATVTREGTAPGRDQEKQWLNYL